eukprot:1176129-Prorocentrum_minimum.AAC.3
MRVKRPTKAHSDVTIIKRHEAPRPPKAQSLSDAFQGAVLFTDIAGYSKLTECLHLKMKSNSSMDRQTIRWVGGGLEGA